MTPRPIETAPKNVFILAFSPPSDQWFVVKWDSHWKRFSIGGHDGCIAAPSHWLPAPPPPYRGVEGIPGWYL